jgi:hypothetical protein
MNLCSTIFKGVQNMNAREAFAKISTDAGAISLAKLIQTGRIENPFDREQWDALLAYQAAANFPDCSKAQAFSRYLDTEVGRQMFWASKCAPAAKEYLAKAAGPADPLADLQKADAEVRGPAHAEMHSKAIDYQRTRGNSYSQAYAHVYSHADNAALRRKVQSEHLGSTMAGLDAGEVEKAQSGASNP